MYNGPPSIFFSFFFVPSPPALSSTNAKVVEKSRRFAGLVGSDAVWFYVFLVWKGFIQGKVKTVFFFGNAELAIQTRLGWQF